MDIIGLFTWNLFERTFCKAHQSRWRLRMLPRLSEELSKQDESGVWVSRSEWAYREENKALGPKKDDPVEAPS